MDLHGLHKATGLTQQDQNTVYKLVEVLQKHSIQNEKRRRYYEEKVNASQVNIGIAVPPSMLDVGKTITCSWAKKAVISLATRSIFDGFVWRDSAQDDTLTRLVVQNNLQRQYTRAIRAQLYHGVTFATLSKGEYSDPACVVRFHTAETASALYDGRRAQIGAGLAIVDIVHTGAKTTPVQVNIYTPESLIELTRSLDDLSTWKATYKTHSAGRPLMEALAFQPDELHPFGQSRISDPVMSLCDSYLRERLRMELGAELFTSPQKVILGAKEEDFEMDKYKAYMTNILLLSKDQDGDVPSLMELPAQSMQPHVEVMRNLAAQFAGATNIPISELGVVHDNPASAQAIYAAAEPLIIEAQNLNADNGEALENIATLMYAIGKNIPMTEATTKKHEIIASFKNPAMPSIVSQADSMVKIASCDPGFAGTEVFYEQLGFTQSNIDRVKAEKVKNRSIQTMTELVNG